MGCEIKESHLGQKEEWWECWESNANGQASARWIPRRAWNPPTFWVIQLVSAGLAKKNTSSLAAAVLGCPFPPHPGAASALGLVGLGSLPGCVGLSHSWQLHKSQSLTLLQWGLAWIWGSAAVYQYRVLSSQIGIAQSCMARWEADLWHLCSSGFLTGKNWKLGLLFISFSLGWYSLASWERRS